MSGLVWLLFLMKMMMMLSDASDPRHVVRVLSGDDVLLDSSLMLEETGDVRWTHAQLLVKNNMIRCEIHCELMADGSLRLRRVQRKDSGNYTMEAFRKDGKLIMRRYFLLQVDDPGSAFSYVFPLLLLSIFFVVLFVLWRRRTQRTQRTQRTMTSGPKEENLYVVMNAGKKPKVQEEDEEEDKKEDKKEKEEESAYVPCSSTISVEPEEDIYV
ncbi:uncharacterized protein LOC125021537 [Mugil cephalus]|uniref:uncharacterized protein LOC125021537 n=1 Tax=Mugil cephalus TaxID=48193 RepID=UPI001FB5BED8|nr:uncharacterized protein LOC125021537 [Mugil cephalus]